MIASALFVAVDLALVVVGWATHDGRFWFGAAAFGVAAVLTGRPDRG